MANQYLITAYDFTDSQALEHRLAARPYHLEAVKKLKETGNFIIGGAILNSEGNMVGSSLIVQFENEAAVQQYLQTDPYTTQQVWDKIEIKPFRVAQV